MNDMNGSTFVGWVAKIERLTGLSYIDLVSMKWDLLEEYKRGKTAEKIYQELKEERKPQ